MTQPSGRSSSSGTVPAPSRVSRRAMIVGGTVSAIGLPGCTGLFSTRPSLPECENEQYDMQERAVAGDAAAELTVEVFEDFSCPACARFNREVVPEIKRDYVDAGDVAYVHRDFPIPIDEWSWKAANAARAVQREAGADALFAFVDAAYENFDEYSEALFVSLGEQEGVDESVVRTAMEQRPFCSFLRSEREAGEARGVEGTPTAIIDDELLIGPDESELAEAIDRAL